MENKIELEVTFMSDEHSNAIYCDRILYFPNEEDLKRIQKLKDLVESNSDIITINATCSGEYILETYITDDIYEPFDYKDDYLEPMLVVSTLGICLRFDGRYTGETFETNSFNI